MFGSCIALCFWGIDKHYLNILIQSHSLQEEYFRGLLFSWSLSGIQAQFISAFFPHSSFLKARSPATTPETPSIFNLGIKAYKTYWKKLGGLIQIQSGINAPKVDLRCVLLIVVVMAMESTYVVEQPSSSLLMLHDRFAWLLNKLENFCLRDAWCAWRNCLFKQWLFGSLFLCISSLASGEETSFRISRVWEFITYITI